jgi:hypothetical protein
MLIDNKFVAVADLVVHVCVPMGFRAFPSFVFMLVVFAVHVRMLMIGGIMIMV